MGPAVVFERLETLAATPLRWSRPSVRAEWWELRAGQALLARWKHSKWWSSMAIAESVDGTWTLKPTGFWRSGASVRDPLGREVAAYRPAGWRQGGVQLADGRRLLWESEGFWRPRFFLRSEQHATLVAFTPERGSWFRHEIRVDLSSGRPMVREMGLLLILGGYLVVVWTRHQAAAAGAG